MRSGQRSSVTSCLLTYAREFDDLAARSTFTLNGAPGATPTNVLRIFSMLSSDTTGMPSTERMMSAPTGISRPPMVTIPSLPCRPMFHAIEPSATVLTRNPAGAGTLKTVARRPVSKMPWRAPQNTLPGDQEASRALARHDKSQALAAARL
jgi:hypothetical protein